MSSLNHLSNSELLRVVGSKRVSPVIESYASGWSKLCQSAIWLTPNPMSHVRYARPH
jgi:hypothetical protein